MSEVHVTLLGQMILDKQVYFSAALPETCFPQGFERDMYRVLSKRYESGDGVDLQLLARALPDWPASRIAEVTDSVVTSAGWRHYVDEVKRDWLSAQLNSLGNEIIERRAAPDALEWIHGKLAGLVDLGQAEVAGSAAMVAELIETLEQRYRSRGKLPGLRTGLTELDNVLLGLRPRHLYYIGARPSDGKTALLVTLICNLCSDGVPVGLLSLESSRKEIMARIFANAGNIDNQDLITGNIGGDFHRVSSVAEKVHGWKLFICDKENMTISTIRAKAREMVSVHGVKALMLDYVQIVPPTDSRQPFRLHMNEVSMALKQIARELEVPVIAAAQLGRSAQDTRPTLSDFKETGQLEQDADGAILIHHSSGEEGSASYLIVAKNRDGPKQEIEVDFNRRMLRFTEREKRR
jgi:replicative DNA helicase